MRIPFPAYTPIRRNFHSVEKLAVWCPCAPFQFPLPTCAKAVIVKITVSRFVRTKVNMQP